jgi:hypothetical protein
MIIQNQFADCIWELVTLPLALDSPGALTLA